MKNLYEIVLILCMVELSVLTVGIAQTDYIVTESPIATLQPTIIATITPEPTEAMTKLTEMIKIQNFVFNPQIVKIYENTSVTWINLDNVTHTVTSIDGIFDSGSLNTGDTFSYTFNQYGKYEYKCNIHPNISHGQISVIESPIATLMATLRPTVKSTIKVEPTEITVGEAATRPTERNIIEETIEKEEQQNRSSPGFELIVTITALILMIYIFRKY